MNGETRLVHLSDIHFSYVDDGSPYDLNADLRSQLTSDLVRMRSDLGEMHGILVTGDIAFSGQAHEFEIAADWLDRVCTEIGLGREHVWVVPGNHDVDRQVVRSQRLLELAHRELRECEEHEIPGILQRLLYEDKSAGELMFAKLAAYNEFAAAYQCLATAANPVWSYPLRLNDGSELMLWGLNTALLCDEHEDRANLVLGPMQTAQMQEQPGRTYLTLAHHPPAWLRDEHDVDEILLARAHVQLFGHSHIFEPRFIDGRLRVVAGATQPERDRDWIPHYNLLEMSVGSTADGEGRTLDVVLHPRKWSRRQRRFAPDITAEGDPSRRYKIPLPSWTRPADEEGTPADEAPVPTGAGEDQSEDVPTASEPVDSLRRVTYLLLRLPHHRRISALRDLGLLPGDDPDTGLEAIREALCRAEEQGRLRELHDWLERLHRNDGASSERE